MENTNVQEVKMPITYDDLKASMIAVSYTHLTLPTTERV